MCRLLTLIALISSCSAASQSLPEVDLLFRFEVIPARFVALGTNVTVRLAVTNLSTTRPAIGEIVILRSVPPDKEPYDVFNPTGQPSNCGPCIGSDLCFRTEIIPAGETRYCDLYRVAAQYVGIPIRARAGVIHAQGTAIDPNPSNNIEQITIGILPPTPVQVPLSPLSYGLMSVLMLGLGSLVARRS